TQPSECEIRWTHDSSAGNSRRYSRSGSGRSAMVSGVLALRGLLRGPLREHLVADVPQLGEEPLLEAVREQLRRLALERRRAGPDDAIDQHQVALPPGLEQLVVVDQALA